MLGALSGNSDLYSVVDVSNWNNTKSEKIEELRELYKKLISLTLV